MNAAKHMETALRNDVADCERRVIAAKPKPVISKGKLLQRGDLQMLEVAQRDLESAVRRLEHWLANKGK